MSARILFERGWTTPERMAAITWDQRVQALDEGGYVRYDERTSTMLGETAQMLLDLYRGSAKPSHSSRARSRADSKKLATLVRTRRDFVRLVSALVRVQLEHRHDEILLAAR